MFRLIGLYSCTGFVLATQLIFSLSWKEKFQGYAPSARGSFVVTEHQKTVSFLRIYACQDSLLFLEEINIPAHTLGNNPVDWDQWLTNKAPHHTSWLLYQIDLNQCTITDCYSFSRNSYISLHHQQSFLTTLMTLPLQTVPLKDRKKIGVASSHEDLDTRKIWNPPKILEGKRYIHPRFEMMHAKWPKDDSELSGKLIDLYFDQDQPLFPFPYWIEVGDGHNVFKIRVIDSGCSLAFPFKEPPKHPPVIETLALLPTGLHILLNHALALKEFQVILSAYQDHVHVTIPLPHTVSTKAGKIELHVSQESLSQHMHTSEERKTFYTVSIIPVDNPAWIMEYPHPITLSSK
jgi:hypothetical protein